MNSTVLTTHKANGPIQYGVVLPAGGLGKRMGAHIPKQLLPLKGKPMYKHSLELFMNHPLIQQVVVCFPTDWEDHFREDLKNTQVTLVAGGALRWESVRNGILALHPSITHVLVHDIARPFVSPAVIDATLAECTQSPCLVAKPCADTVKQVQQDGSVVTLDRETIWLAQTPQAFAVQDILALYNRLAEFPAFEPTDEAGIFEKFNIPVTIVPGDSLNDKITTTQDFLRFGG
jgi:2-C-methyl-D-erythritol 4-phosphate cytidylyltransferase